MNQIAQQIAVACVNNPHISPNQKVVFKKLA